MEILSIRLKTTKFTWLELYNVYLPNTFNQHNSTDPSLIKLGPSSLILSELIGHSQMLDPSQTQDFGVGEILEWILKTIYISSMMHLLLEPVESSLTIAPPTSPSVGGIGQQKHHEI